MIQIQRTQRHEKVPIIPPRDNFNAMEITSQILLDRSIYKYAFIIRWDHTIGTIVVLELWYCHPFTVHANIFPFQCNKCIFPLPSSTQVLDLGLFFPYGTSLSVSRRAFKGSSENGTEARAVTVSSLHYNQLAWLGTVAGWLAAPGHADFSGWYQLPHAVPPPQALNSHRIQLSTPLQPSAHPVHSRVLAAFQSVRGITSLLHPTGFPNKLNMNYVPPQHLRNAKGICYFAILLHDSPNP